ncbi:MAG: glycosyltransferase [Planctomycetota bacterium]|nr:glycosyltransferase [Planctomycetota bacterium]
MAERVLIFVPTYNERGNAEKLFNAILALNVDADVLFCDDNSPDGTGGLLDSLAASHPRLRVLHRQGKLGIGSAHLDGIHYAYDNNYDRLVTMDCDFTHPPECIPAILEASRKADVAIGSRWIEKGSLPGWNLLRRFLTHFGHFLTRFFLGMPYDASGAFRVYALRSIPREAFQIVRSRSYSFFFESLFVLVRNGHTVTEIPIKLPARTYGHSKMTFRDASRSARLLYKIWLQHKLHPERFRTPKRIAVDPVLKDPQNWSPYWDRSADAAGACYEIVASIYRRLFIRSRLERALKRQFPKGARLLHAGCGAGQVDRNLHDAFDITAADICPQALRSYSQNNPRATRIEHVNILDLPYPPAVFDGVYNLGVMEHFPPEEITRILKQFCRVLRPDGKVVIFWPHRRAVTVLVIKALNLILRTFFGRKEALHPPEISLLKGRQEAAAFLQSAGLEMCAYDFGIRDGCVQAVIVGRKAALGSAAHEPTGSSPAPLATKH